MSRKPHRYHPQDDGTINALDLVLLNELLHDVLCHPQMLLHYKNIWKDKKQKKT
jgi:hypothetical protein